MQTLEHHEISGKQEKGRGRVNTRVGEKRQPKNESKGDSIPQTKNQMKMAPKILKIINFSHGVTYVVVIVPRKVLHAPYQFQPAPYHVSKFPKLPFILDWKIWNSKNII